MQCVHLLNDQAIQRQSGLTQKKQSQLHAGDRIRSHTVLKIGLRISAVVGYMTKEAQTGAEVYVYNYC
jgi:hypothetical protein